MPDLEIRLLGRFEILVNGTGIEESKWSRKKAKVLLKLLALAPNRKMHREQLIDILWPDADAEDALNNFHKIMHAARRVLEPGLPTGSASRFLLTQESLVSLAASDIRVDVEEFERLAASALRSAETDALEAARALYRGDLLEEDIYEDWASVRREQVRLTCQRVLERLAANYEAASDERAVDVLNRLLAMNRANEEAHRCLMRCYAAAGRRHLALNQYRICCEALRQELDTAPEAATVELYESLLAGTPLQTPPAAGEGALIVPAATPARRGNRRWLAAAAAAMLFGSVGAAFLLSRKPTSSPTPSLAILPLRGTAGVPELENLADGITEELINSTSRLPGIRVMARGTVFVYKGRADAREVGRELKVSAVVFGYVRPEGENVSVGVELIDVADGARLWARKYSAPRQTPAPLQQLLSAELGTAARTKLSGGNSQVPTPARRSTADAEAYRLYLTGRAFWNQRTPEAFRKSIEYYRQAIEHDPSYGLAYAGLADSYGLLGFNDPQPRDYFPRARESATKALELDESLAEAQTSLAMVSALYDWNWVAAEAQFRRAIELNPGYATAHHWFGVHLGAMGRFEESERELEAALNLDPLSPIVNLNRGYPALYQHRYREALAIFDKALSLNANFLPAHEDRMTASALSGDTAAAAREAVQFLRLSGSLELAAAAESAAARGGYAAALKVWLDELERSPGHPSPPLMTVARVALALGDREKSLGWLERAFEQHSPQLVYLGVDPQYDALRADPRFEQLLRRVGLARQ